MRVVVLVLAVALCAAQDIPWWFQPEVPDGNNNQQIGDGSSSSAPAVNPGDPNSPTTENPFEKSSYWPCVCGQGISCVCVLYYQCVNDTVLTTGEDLLDDRFNVPPVETCPGVQRCCREPPPEEGDNPRPSPGPEQTPATQPPPPPPPPVPSSEGPTPDTSPPTPFPVPGPDQPVKSGCGVRRGPSPSDTNSTLFGEFPWMLMILTADYPEDGQPPIDVFKCGASLINPQVALTAAHCVDRILPSDLKVRAGEWDVNLDSEPVEHQDRRVIKIVKHPEFELRTLFNDVALLFLNAPFNQRPNVEVACLPPPNIDLNGQRCIATGWGTSNADAGTFQTSLKKVELPIVDHDSCQQQLRTTRLGRYFRLHKSFICAGGEPNVDTCRGEQMKTTPFATSFQPQGTKQIVKRSLHKNFRIGKQFEELFHKAIENVPALDQVEKNLSFLAENVQKVPDFLSSLHHLSENVGDYPSKNFEGGTVTTPVGIAEILGNIFGSGNKYANGNGYNIHVINPETIAEAVINDNTRFTHTATSQEAGNNNPFYNSHYSYNHHWHNAHTYNNMKPHDFPVQQYGAMPYGQGILNYSYGTPGTSSYGWLLNYGSGSHPQVYGSTGNNGAADLNQFSYTNPQGNPYLIHQGDFYNSGGNMHTGNQNAYNFNSENSQNPNLPTQYPSIDSTAGPFLIGNNHAINTHDHVIPIVNLYNQGRPVGNSHNQERPSGNPHNQGRPSGNPHNQGRPSGNPHNQGRPSGNPHNQGRPSGNPHNQGRPSGNPHNQGGDSGYPQNQGGQSGYPQNQGGQSGYPQNQGGHIGSTTITNINDGNKYGAGNGGNVNLSEKPVTTENSEERPTSSTEVTTAAENSLSTYWWMEVTEPTGMDTATEVPPIYGDGGGPLICPIADDPDRYIQVGIVSWGIGCGGSDMPAVYANLPYFRNWVDQQLEANEFINIAIPPASVIDDARSKVPAWG